MSGKRETNARHQTTTTYLAEGIYTEQGFATQVIFADQLDEDYDSDWFDFGN